MEAIRRCGDWARREAFPRRLLLDGNDQLYRIWQQLDDLKLEVTPGIKHQTVLVKLLQASRNLPYLRRKKNGKKNNDSGD